MRVPGERAHALEAGRDQPRPFGLVLDRGALAWAERTGVPLFAWSSGASGFFSARFSPDVRDNRDVVRVYYRADNWHYLGLTEGKKKILIHWDKTNARKNINKYVPTRQKHLFVFDYDRRPRTVASRRSGFVFGHERPKGISA